MKKLLLIGLLAILVTSLLPNLINAQHFTTVWSGSPYQSMAIIVQGATIDGVDMEAGDEIAVFDDDGSGNEICVGTVVLTGIISPTSAASFAASHEESGGDGFITGNTIVYKMWDNSESLEITMVVPTYTTYPGFDEVYTPMGTALVTNLAGSSSIETTATSVTACAGTVTVPIDVLNIGDVGEFSLIMDYGATNLSYTSYQNANTQLGSGTLTVTESSGEITIYWTSTTAANITTGTLLELVFTASTVTTQTTENLTWNETSSYYNNTSGSVLPAVFNNGVVTINPVPANAGTISGASDVCQGTSGEVYQVGAITNATSYVWAIAPTSAGTISGSGTNISINFSSTYSGQANLSVFGVNSCGNGVSSSLTVNVTGNATVSAGAAATICYDNTYTLSGSATNYQTVLWATSGDGTFINATTTTPVYTPGINDKLIGTVTLTITANAISPCANSASDNMVLTLQQPPTVDSGVADTIPDGSSTTLAGSATGGTSPYTYLWSPSTGLSNPNIANPVASPTITTTYTLTVTDYNGCVGVDSVRIVVTHFMNVWSGNPYQPMNILVSGATVDGIDLVAGDEVAIFDVDGSGNEICVGFGIVSQTIAPAALLGIVASSDDPSTTEIDGFTAGNSIVFKAWSAVLQEEYTTFQATYNSVFDDTFTTLGTALVDVAFITYITQTSNLSQGWNIMSFYVEPDNMNLLTILDPLVTSTELTKVINEAGGFIQYIPGLGWMNTIGDMAVTEGYYIKVTANTSFDAIGMVPDTPINILLNTGWNIMGYPVDQSQDAITILQPLINDSELIKVINEAGGFIQFIPGLGWMNTIGDFDPGEGYYIKVNTNTSLDINIATSSSNFYGGVVNPPSLYFKRSFENNPYYPMNIVITGLNIEDHEITPGDEIAVFNGELCVGVGVISNDKKQPISITASMDDPLTDDIDRFTEGNKLSIKYLSSTNCLPVDLYIEGVLETQYFSPLSLFFLHSFALIS